MSKPAAEYFQMGVKLARLGRWEEAADTYRHALQDDPQNVDALTNLGFVYYEMGLDLQAQDAFSAAQSLRGPVKQCDSTKL